MMQNLDFCVMIKEIKQHRAFFERLSARNSARRI